MKKRDNIYRAASPRKLDKFNSDPPTFTESAHIVTQQEKQNAQKRIQEMIEKIKDDLNNED